MQTNQSFLIFRFFTGSILGTRITTEFFTRFNSLPRNVQCMENQLYSSLCEMQGTKPAVKFVNLACSGVSNADLMSNLTVVMNASILTGASHVKPHVYIACTFTHITCNGNIQYTLHVVVEAYHLFAIRVEYQECDHFFTQSTLACFKTKQYGE